MGVRNSLVALSRHADIPDSGFVPNLAPCFGSVGGSEWRILAIIISISLILNSKL